MESNTNPALGFLGFWMLMQLVATLAFLVGGIYVLYCLGRAAAGLDRLASAVEEWVQHNGQSVPNQSTPDTASALPPSDLSSTSMPANAPRSTPLSTLSTPVPPVPPVQPQPFTPAAPPSTPAPSEYSPPRDVP